MMLPSVKLTPLVCYSIGGTTSLYRATIHTSAFLFAAAMVLLFNVSGKCLTVIMHSSQMGIPGTSLTIRRAIRLLMDESHYSVRNLLTDMSDVARSLGSIAAEYAP